MYSIDWKPLGARVAAATFVGAMMLAVPMLGPTTDLAVAASKQKAPPAHDVETRIKTLHGQLRITAEQ